jgi:hypothetical protein
MKSLHSVARVKRPNLRPLHSGFLLFTLLMIPLAAHAQSSPFDTGLTSIQTLFTGTVAKASSLIAIVLGGCPQGAAVSLVRPAWAHSYGCKSRRELVTASEAKRNCMRVTECGLGSVERNCGPMNKNRIEGGANQGERANNREALVTKGRRRKSGGRAVKKCVLTWGDLALRLKG